MTEISALLEQSDKLTSETSLDVISVSGPVLLEASTSFVKRLHSLHRGLRETSQNPPYWVVPCTLSNPADADASAKVFPFAFQFADLNTGIVVVTHWAVLAQINCSIARLNDLLAPVRHSSPGFIEVWSVASQQIGNRRN